MRKGNEIFVTLYGQSEAIVTLCGRKLDGGPCMWEKEELVLILELCYNKPGVFV
jgi:hypothetical protein